MNVTVVVDLYMFFSQSNFIHGFKYFTHTVSHIRDHTQTHTLTIHKNFAPQQIKIEIPIKSALFTHWPRMSLKLDVFHFMSCKTTCDCVYFSSVFIRIKSKFPHSYVIV